MVARKQDDDFEEVEIDLDTPVYTTGVVCRVLEIPIWVLKQLDREGIVSPPRKSGGQARLYTKRELKKVQHCWFYMREQGVKIPGLRVILDMEQGIIAVRKKRP